MIHAQPGVWVDADYTAAFATGVLASATPLAAGQIQPASCDLRLGDTAYRIQAGFLPGQNRTVSACLQSLSMGSFSLTAPHLFEKGSVYLVPLQETITLPPFVHGRVSPKSSTGRLDIFVRLITDNGTAYDTIPSGYVGPLFLEISPLTFPIMARMGDRLTQLRLSSGPVAVEGPALTALHSQTPLLTEIRTGSHAPLSVSEGAWVSINLHGPAVEANPIVGYRARHHTQPVDLANIAHYPWRQFWEPITREDCAPLILYPEEFYIFASKEGICIPPTHAAEMVAYDTRVGEIRVHYAGFFDPGFGYAPATGKHGTTAVMEVRAHDVPYVLEDGQPIGRFVFESLTRPPHHLYGADIGSNYAGQSLKLAKQFTMPQPTATGAAA